MKSRWVGLVFVVIFSVLFAIRQYQPGTWLMGWDSLHPEFNYPLALERVISGVWRESQGLGAIAVHSHMSELPRIVTLWIIDWVVPTSMVRWTYILLMLVLGVVGTYVLLIHILSRIRGKLRMGWVSFVAVVGSFAYLFNLSTLHHFLVPFEMFVVLFGFLPWSLWSVSRYLQAPSKMRLICFLLIQFLISSSAFAATLWIVYFAVLVFTIWFLTNNKKQWLKLVALTLVINSYWLLPTVYGLITSGSLVASAKINQMFSPEAWLNNVEYGTPGKVIRLESFILQWMSYDFANHKFDLIVAPWIKGVNQHYVWIVLNVVGAMVGFGLSRGIYLAMARAGKYIRKWSGLFFVGLILFAILMARVWPMSVGIEWARDNLPLVGELLRTPFTKVSVFLQLIYALLIGVGLLWMVEKVRFNFVRGILAIVAVGVVIYPFKSWIIKGNLMSEAVVTRMPSEYARLFEATSLMKDGRMMAMPMPSMWGWEYSDWGYQGANFTQFGISEPLLIRDFDRWSPYNESFYSQLSTVLYGGDKEGIRRVIRQYDVQYVLLDESVIAPGQVREFLRIDETKKIASELGWSEKFKDGLLTVWDTGLSNNQFVSAPDSYTLTDGEMVKTRKDVMYDDVGTYVTQESVNQENSESVVTYPFTSLMKEEIKNVEYRENRLVISSDNVPTKMQELELRVPGWKVGDIVRIDFLDNKPLPAYTINGQDGPIFLGKEKPARGVNYFVAKVNENKEWEQYLSDKVFKIEGGKVVVEVFAEPISYSFAENSNGEIVNCDVLHRGAVSKVDNKYIADDHGALCDYIVMKELDTRLSYVMRVNGENVAGRSVKFFLHNTGSSRNDIEYLLNQDKFEQVFSLLPWAYDGFYALNIDVHSFGERTENIMDKVEVRYLPLDKIVRAKLMSSSRKEYLVPNKLEIVKVKKIGTWLYIVQTKNAGLLRLSQGYDKGWVSPWVEHVRVDGWANGWMVPGSVTIAIFYWPQLLEYLGFIVLGIVMLFLVFKRK